jgi:hypothetical protein
LNSINIAAKAQQQQQQLQQQQHLQHQAQQQRRISLGETSSSRLVAPLCHVSTFLQ